MYIFHICLDVTSKYLVFFLVTFFKLLQITTFIFMTTTSFLSINQSINQPSVFSTIRVTRMIIMVIHHLSPVLFFFTSITRCQGNFYIDGDRCRQPQYPHIFLTCPAGIKLRSLDSVCGVRYPLSIAGPHPLPSSSHLPQRPPGYCAGLMAAPADR